MTMDAALRETGTTRYTAGGGSFIHLGGRNQSEVTTGTYGEPRDMWLAARWLRWLVERVA